MERIQDREIEKAFARAYAGSRSTVVLDGIDWRRDGRRFCIRSRDQFGQLPDIVITWTGKRRQLVDRVVAEASELHAIHQIRGEIRRFFPEHEFLEHTRLQSVAIVGLKGVHFFTLGVGKNFLDAYQTLRDKLLASL